MKKIILLIYLGLCSVMLLSCKDDANMVDQTKLPDIEINSVQRVNMQGIATIIFTIKNDGGDASTEHGICYSDTKDLPTINDNIIKGEATGEGQYSVTLTGLGIENDYRVRVYAKNAAGLTYTDPTILRAARGVPEVMTLKEKSDLTANSVTLSAEIIDEGGDKTAKRAVYIGRTLPFDEKTWVKHVAEGTGIGKFSVAIGDLRSFTTYYYMGYAENDKGANHGDINELVTLPGRPEGGALTITKRDRGAFVMTDIFNGGEKLTKIILCVGEQSNPTTGEEVKVSNVENATFLMMNKPATTYYLRVYAENKYGNSYGDEISYTTANEGAPQPSITVDGIVYPVIRWGGYDLLSKNLQVFKDNIGTGDNQAAVFTHPGESVKPGIGEVVGCFYRHKQAVQACEYVAQQTGEKWRLPSVEEWGNILDVLELAYGAPETFTSHNGDFTLNPPYKGYKGVLAGRVICNAPDGTPSLSGIDITVGGITGNGNTTIGSWNNATAESRSGMWTSTAWVNNTTEHFWREFRYRSAANASYPEPKFCDQVSVDKIGNYSFNVRCIKDAK